MKHSQAAFAVWLASFAVVYAIACDGGPSAGSESHFLERCDPGVCAAGLECVCGVCSRRCSETSACADIGAAAQCTPLSALAPTITCEGAPGAPESICASACTVDADCAALGATYRCEVGVCIAPAPTADAGRDAGADTATDAPRPECPTTLPAQGTECPIRVGTCTYPRRICGCNGQANCGLECPPTGSWDCAFDRAALEGVVTITRSSLTFDCRGGAPGSSASGEIDVAFMGIEEPLSLEIAEPTFVVSAPGKPEVTYYNAATPRTFELAAGSSSTETLTLLPSAGRSNRAWNPCDYCDATYELTLTPGVTTLGNAGNAAVVHPGTVTCLR